MNEMIKLTSTDTYTDIYKELMDELGLIREKPNFFSFYSNKYFSQSFLDRSKEQVRALPPCNCANKGPILIKEETFYKSLKMLIGTYLHRHDILYALDLIFSKEYLLTEQKQITIKHEN
jgi:hypothetical protein